MSASDIHHVINPAEQGLDVFRRLQDRDLKQRGGLFIAEGLEAVRHLLASGLRTQAVLATPQRLRRLEDCLPTGIPVYVAEREVMEAVIGFPVNRGGVMACAIRPAPLDLDGAVARGCAEPRTLAVALENITDAQNVGLIVRSAVAFGAGAAILANCCDPFYRRAVRVSMGAVFRLPIHACGNLASSLRHLRERHGFTTIAATATESALPIRSMPPADRTVLVFGSEGAGLSQETIDACDRQVVIPMSPGSDSVNVAVAAGVFLYHFAPSVPS